MAAAQIRPWGPKVDRFRKRFDDGFARKDTRAPGPVFVPGQLADGPDKRLEPSALEAGVPPRTRQEFLRLRRWQDNTRRDRLPAIVREEHADPPALGSFDETRDATKGDHPPGVPKPWCGRLGKTENGLVTVHLGYAAGDFPGRLDGALLVPDSGANDRARCREAGLADTVT